MTNQSGPFIKAKLARKDVADIRCVSAPNSFHSIFQQLGMLRSQGATGIPEICRECLQPGSFVGHNQEERHGDTTQVDEL
jgi:hypothetical protein